VVVGNVFFFLSKLFLLTSTTKYLLPDIIYKSFPSLISSTNHILPLFTKGCNFWNCANQASINFTKFVINNINIYISNKIYYKNYSIINLMASWILVLFIIALAKVQKFGMFNVCRLSVGFEIRILLWFWCPTRRCKIVNIILYLFLFQIFHVQFGMCRRKLVGSLPWGIPTVVVYR
jgi:hypothetical protein